MDELRYFSIETEYPPYLSLGALPGIFHLFPRLVKNQSIFMNIVPIFKLFIVQYIIR
jgi:hypothetical protein